MLQGSLIDVNKGWAPGTCVFGSEDPDADKWEFIGQEAGLQECPCITPVGEIRTFCILAGTVPLRKGHSRVQGSHRFMTELVAGFFCVFWIIITIGSKQHRGFPEHTHREFLRDYLKCLHKSESGCDKLCEMSPNSPILKGKKKKKRVTVSTLQLTPYTHTFTD